MRLGSPIRSGIARGATPGRGGRKAARIALAGLASAWSYRGRLGAVAGLYYLWGLAWWLGNGVIEIERYGDAGAIVKSGLNAGEQIVAAGADTCVAGSAVFGAPDADGGYRGVMQALKQAAVA